MDKTRIEAIGHQIKGTLKENLGKVLGDAKLKADGAAERAVGEAENTGGIDRVAGIDTDRIKGVGRQFAGAVKQGFGNLVGSTKLAAEGSVERAAGKAQNEVGSARDEARDAAGVQQPGKKLK
jgi:uncharacterized protein YjbJ (UPF0337 family)